MNIKFIGKRRETEEWQENRRKSNEAAKLARLQKQQEKAAKEKAAKEKRIEKQQETAEQLGLFLISFYFI